MQKELKVVTDEVAVETTKEIIAFASTPAGQRWVGVRGEGHG